MKFIFKLGFLVFLVCAVAGGVLSFVFSVTNPKIKENIERDKKKYRKSVLPDAEEFVQFGDNENIFVGVSSGKELGKVVFMNNAGYSGKIYMVLGVDDKGKVSGVNIVNQTETPGLGTNITKPDFLDQFKNLDKASNLDLKKDSPKGKIDAITGATISSRAVSEAVKKEFGVLKNLMTDYKDGVFEGKVKGHGGMISIKVFIKQGRITDFKAYAPYETESLWKSVMSSVFPSVIAKQSVKGIDVVTGATDSSRACLKAIEIALDKSKEAV